MWKQGWIREKKYKQKTWGYALTQVVNKTIKIKLTMTSKGMHKWCLLSIEETYWPGWVISQIVFCAFLLRFSSFIN